MATEIPEPPSKFARRTGDRSERCFPNLTSQVLYGGLLKTPTVMDGVITTGKKNPVGGNSGTLAQEIASGFVYRRGILPTPTTQEIAHPDAEISPTGRRLAKNGNGNSHSMGLADLASNRLLPTPVVCLDGVYPDKNPQSRRHSMSIATMAYHGMLPTPRASKITGGDRADFSPSLPGLMLKGMLPTPRANIVNGLNLYNPKIANRNNGNLEEAVSKLLLSGLIPTPTTSSRNGGTAREREDGVSRRSELNHLVAQDFGTTSQLSPLFVEQMMGFPIGWILMPFLKESPNTQEPSPLTDGEPNP